MSLAQRLGCFSSSSSLPDAFAAKHPVPLDPKADPSTCLACHEDKTKGKSVHSAIAMGCTGCHEIRTNKDVTHVKLITTTPHALCLTCHADKNAADIKGTVHPPAVRDCLKCHDPHSRITKSVVEADLGRSERESLPQLPQHRPECSGERQPPRRARHGLRHLPHHPQDRRSGQGRVRFPSDQSAACAVPRLPRCQETLTCKRRTRISPSRQRIA